VLLEKFTAETGIKVVYDTYESNEVLETKLMAGKTGYDVVVPSTGFLDRQIAAGALQKLDRSRLPNWSNLDREILQHLNRHDPGNQYAVNYVGTAGSSPSAGEGGDAGCACRQLAPHLRSGGSTNSGLRYCPIDAPSDISFIALSYLGKDPNSESPEDLALAEKTLLAIRPYIRMIDAARYIDALATGEICVAVGWNGGVLQARDRAAEAGQGHVIKYSIPKEDAAVLRHAGHTEGRAHRTTPTRSSISCSGPMWRRGTPISSSTRMETRRRSRSSTTPSGPIPRSTLRPS
jgi:putrescine transport system substrate-binding protein